MAYGDTPYELYGNPTQYNSPGPAPSDGSYTGARDDERNTRVEQGDYWSRDLFPSMGQAFMGEHDFRSQAPQVQSGEYTDDRNMQLHGRSQQENWNAYLRDLAMGNAGPSVAQLQMQEGLAQAQKQAASQAAGARGANVGLASYQAAGTQADLANQANRDAAMLRAQEQMAREKTFTDALVQQRSQDLQTQGLSLEQAVAQANTEMQAQQINAQIAEGIAGRRQSGAGGVIGAAGAAIGALGMMSDVRAKEDIRPVSDFGQQLRLALEPSVQPGANAQPMPTQDQIARIRDSMQAQQAAQAAAQANMQAQAQAQQAGGGGGATDMIGSIMGGMAGGMMSDRRAKSDIRQSREDLEPVEPYTFRYRPEVALRLGEDTDPRLGVMAQDLAQSPLYQSAVEQDPNGMLALDGKKLLGANTAAIGGIDKRLRNLEKRRA